MIYFYVAIKVPQKVNSAQWSIGSSVIGRETVMCLRNVWWLFK